MVCCLPAYALFIERIIIINIFTDSSNLGLYEDCIRRVDESRKKS